MLTKKRLRGMGLMLGLLLLAAVPAISQTCALCYAQASSSGARFIAALQSGIVVLLVPPLLISVGITLLAYRKRNQFHPTEDGSDLEWTSGA